MRDAHLLGASQWNLRLIAVGQIVGRRKSRSRKGEPMFAVGNIEKPCVSVERFYRQVVNNDGTSYGIEPG